MQAQGRAVSVCSRMSPVCAKAPFVIASVGHACGQCTTHKAEDVRVSHVQALDAHGEAAEDHGSMEAREALLATLQCLHALMSGAAGMRGMLEVGPMLLLVQLLSSQDSLLQCSANMPPQTEIT